MIEYSKREINRGFTLIELMIVVLIIGLLAAIAWPQYQDFVRKSRRADAQADLVELSGFIERYFTINNTYIGLALPFSNSTRTVAIPTTGYTYASVQAATTYTVGAAAVGDQTNDVCGNMTVVNTGVTTPTTLGCWP